MSITLEVGQSDVLSIAALEEDGSPTPGAVLSEINWSIDQAGEIFSNGPTDGETFTVTAQAPGTATANVSARVTETTGASAVITGTTDLVSTPIPPALSTHLGITDAGPTGV